MLRNLKNDDESYNWIYNVDVRFKNSNKTATFSGKLENVDSDKFWFLVNGAIACVNQEDIVLLLPVERVGSVERDKELMTRISDNLRIVMKEINMKEEDLLDFQIEAIEVGMRIGFSTEQIIHAFELAKQGGETRT